jgi:hypothetical protein
MTYFRLSLLAVVGAVWLTACGGGSPCEEYCAGAKDCGHLSLVPGDNCVRGCGDVIEQVERRKGCGKEFEEVLDCAADADDVCNPSECAGETLDYAKCAHWIDD